MSNITGTSTAFASTQTLLEREGLLTEMYRASDRWDSERYDEFLARDVAFRFGNASEAHGRDAIKATMAQMRQLVTEIHHEVRTMIHGVDDHVTAEIDMHYVRRDGAELRVPAGVIFHFDDEGLVDQYRIFIDTGDFFV